MIIILITSRSRTGAVNVMKLPHMLLQVKVPTKSLRADLALKRLLIVVRVHVKRQVVDLMKGLVTNLTFVRLLAAVRQLVVLIVALLMKSLSAELANVRLVAVVDSRVSVEGG